MKKYIVLIIGILSITNIISQNIFSSDELINLKMDSARYKIEINGNDTIYKYISQSIEPVSLSAEDRVKARDLASAFFNKSESGKTRSSNTNYIAMLASAGNVDTSKDVGEIPIQPNITNGMVSYTVPIEVYSGEAGLQPNIALTYNSVAGNGVAGFGWSLSGLSSISLVNSNFHYDGIRAEDANISTNTAFSLDGMRLIKTSEVRPRVQGYISEQGNIQVNMLDTLDKYFEVKFPDGKTAIYGKNGIYSPKIIYPLMKLEDGCGNYVEYTYSEVGRYHYVSEIKYGNSQSVIGSVKFTYTDRTDKSFAYVSGRKVEQTKLLSKIETYFQTTLLRTYNLTSEMKDFSLLTSIACMSEGKELNPLIFSYGEPTPSNGFETGINSFLDPFFPPTSSMIIKKAKFDGQNARDALIVYPKYDTYAILEQSTINGAARFGSKYDPDQKLFVYRNLDSPSGVPMTTTLYAEEGFQDLTAVDIDGDGNDELVKINYVWESDMGKVIITTYDDNFTPRKKSFLIPGAFAWQYPSGVIGNKYFRSPLPRYFLFGDFDGDGKVELLTLHSSKAPNGETWDSSRTTLINLETLQVISETFMPPINMANVNSPEILFAADFGGDGKTDICRKNGTGFRLYEYNSIYSPPAEKLWTGLDDFTGKKFEIGDINGDGKLDILVTPVWDNYDVKIYYYACYSCDGCVRAMNNHQVVNYTDYYPHPHCTNPRQGRYETDRGNSKRWTALYYTGQGFEKEYFDLIECRGWQTIMLQDINNDNLPDLAVREDTNLSVYLNKNGKLSTQSVSTTLPAPENTNVLPHLVPGNLLERYKASQFLVLSGARLVPISYKKNVIKDHLLTTVTNSNKIQTVHTYENMADRGNYYSSSRQFSYPYCKALINMHMAKDVMVYNGYDMIGHTTYQYEDAVINKQGLGFRGFGKITISDNMRYNSTIQTYDPSRFGIMTNIESPTISGTYNYSVVVGSTKTVSITLSDKAERDKLKNISVTSTYRYDIYGNPTKETVDYGNNITSVTDNVFYNYSTSPSIYKIGELREQTVTKTRGNNSVVTKTMITYTNDNKRLPETKKEYYNNNLASEEMIIYDNNNRPAETKNKPYSSANWLSAKFTYDTFGRLKRETDAMGLYVDNIYNEKGQLSSIKNHKGQETKYEYDAWDRNIKTIYPDGTNEVSGLSWASSPEGTLYLLTRTATGKPTAQVYYDALGREIRKGQMRFDGQYLYTDNVYDNKGRLEKTSLPFKTSPDKWNSYTYDNYDRITKLTYASGKIDTYSYNGRSNTQIIDNVAITKTINTLGELISVQDPAGTITYSLRPDGQPGSITAPGNITTTFEYDVYGRQTAIVDPSAGRRTFAYNAAGNINKETDALNNETTMSYDIYNRLTEKNIAGIKTTYTYDTDGLLTTISSNNGISKTMTYDSFGRIDTEKAIIVDGKYMQKKYAYSNGNISSIITISQSGSIGTEYYTYANGYHTETKLNTTSVWKLDTENTMGVPIQITTGPLTRTYTYDAYGMPTGRAAKKGTAVVQNFSYNFNPQTGNLNWRKDNPRNLQENFTYDNLNRLTGFSGKTMAYDIKGNITNHSEIGAFTYNTPKPYTIETVTPYGDAIPLRRQDIAYNAMQRPMSIKENGYEALFTYNADGDRVKMVMKKDNIVQYTRYYLGSEYEIEVAGNGAVTERRYIDGDAYSAACVYVKQGSTWAINYICRDYLGNITHLADANGTLRQELSYDPWGRLRNPANQQLYAADSQPVLLLARGFTGHEHLKEFGLINMNARLYDPVLGRFLSPDPYVQAPLFSQNYNRYSYCLNNPLRYNDESGEFFFGIFNFAKDLFVNTFIKSWDQGFNAWSNKDNWSSTINAFKLDIGLFKGGFWDVVSRFTWQLPQTMLGYTLNQTLNNIYLINDVNYFDGAVVIDSKIKTGGLTLSNYILGPPGFKPDFRDHLFVHEYGHYLQSKKLGPAYLFVVAKPSLLSATLSDEGHSYRWYETQASKLAANYFDKKYGSGSETYKNYEKQGLDPYNQPDIFNINVFINGGTAAYSHPRHNYNDYDAHPIKFKWRRWSDFFFF